MKRILFAVATITILLLNSIAVQAKGMEFRIHTEQEHDSIYEIVTTGEKQATFNHARPKFDALVMVNGDLVDFAVIKSGRSLVPIRNISNMLGYHVNWDAGSRTATLTKGSTTVVLTVDSKIATVNEASVRLDVPAEIIDGKIHIPLRFIGETFGVTVDFFSPHSLDEHAFARSIAWIDELVSDNPIPLQTVIAALRTTMASMDDSYELYLGEFSRYYVFAGKIQYEMVDGRNVYFVNKYTGDLYITGGGSGYLTGIIPNGTLQIN